MNLDISQAEIDLACGGRVTWPDEPERLVKAFDAVREVLCERLGAERVDRADMLGNVGDATFWAGWRRALALKHRAEVKRRYG